MLHLKFMNEKQSHFINYTDIKSILVPENNGIQNTKESNTNNISNILHPAMVIN